LIVDILDASTQLDRIVVLRQSFQFKLFRSKRLKHLHRTIDVSSEIWNHSGGAQEPILQALRERVAKGKAAGASGEAAKWQEEPLESGR
jgi:hypothetical protein